MMRRSTKANTIQLLIDACEALGMDHVYDAKGNYLPNDERPEFGHAVDFGGGSVRGVCVYRLMRDGGGHMRPLDPFFHQLDQRRPHREVDMILRAIADTAEVLR